ncbi:MAG: signal peptide peptidase SppA [Flavobacteriales bacterium]|nr:signal peptide peptidase SppA [Flavobacteriales bacterium]
MKPFWRTFWASSLSTLAIGITLFLFFISIVIGIASSFDSKPFKVDENAILHLKLDNPISEVSYADFNPNSPGLLSKQFGLNDLKLGLQEAINDPNIKGILLNVDDLSAGMASIEEIRNSLLEFKEKSGKFIYSYSETYSQSSYYLSSISDEVFLYPTGMLDFRGLGVELMFFKGAIDKLGIDMQIIRGSNNKFKSAVEPFIYKQMSEENREQVMTYLNSLWDNMLTNIKSSRNISIEQMNEIADSIFVRNAPSAVEYKLVDRLVYEDELHDFLKSKTETPDDDELNLVSFSKYCSSKSKLKKLDFGELGKSGNIAIVNAVGEIVSGNGERNQIGSEKIAGAVKEARLNNDVKAIVLRVNSPGGSALASDVIWREIILAKEAKPVIVSMGDVAASGGYYISCAADWIFAQPNTITGSIGVFGMIPNVGPMMEEKLGITFDRAQTNNHSVLSLTKGLSEKEKSIIQNEVDIIYNDFITKVADGRDGLKVEDVDAIGQGRVWSGTDAIRLGLVDELGGIDDAIFYAAEKAGIEKEEIKTLSLPSYKEDEFMAIIELLDENEATIQTNQTKVYNQIKAQLDFLNNYKSADRIQARLPFELIIK